MPNKIIQKRDSVAYVKAIVTADVDLDMTVAIAITAPGGTHSWLASEWEGTSTTSVDSRTGLTVYTRRARTTSAVTFSTANYPLTGYGVSVKITDSPEVPIIPAGTLTIEP